MIGFYVHHHGAGHGIRATRIAAELEDAVIGMGTGSAPRGWPGEWVELPPDDDDPCWQDLDPDAHGLLHHAPTTDDVRRRAAAMSRALAAHEPSLLVVDVSVEATLLARLHGVPVAVVAQPGVRDDVPHSIAHAVARASIAPWPAWVGDAAWQPGCNVSATPVGAIGPPVEVPTGTLRDPDLVALLVGRGGHSLDVDAVRDLARSRPGLRFELLGDVLEGVDEPNVAMTGWVDDVGARLAAAAAVVTHGGQTSVATVAATRTPAVVVPQQRPFEEQECLARLLGERGLATVVDRDAGTEALAGAIDVVRGADGGAWELWDDGLGAVRAAGLVAAIAESG